MYSVFLLQEMVRVGGLWVRMGGILRVGWVGRLDVSLMKKMNE